MQRLLPPIPPNVCAAAYEVKGNTLDIVIDALRFLALRIDDELRDILSPGIVDYHIYLRVKALQKQFPFFGDDYIHHVFAEKRYSIADAVVFLRSRAIAYPVFPFEVRGRPADELSSILLPSLLCGKLDVRAPHLKYERGCDHRFDSKKADAS